MGAGSRRAIGDRAGGAASGPTAPGAVAARGTEGAVPAGADVAGVPRPAGGAVVAAAGRPAFDAWGAGPTRTGGATGLAPDAGVADRDSGCRGFAVAGGVVTCAGGVTVGGGTREAVCGGGALTGAGGGATEGAAPDGGSAPGSGDASGGASGAAGAVVRGTVPDGVTGDVGRCAVEDAGAPGTAEAPRGAGAPLVAAPAAGRC
jgi:hypothetical protein